MRIICFPKLIHCEESEELCLKDCPLVVDANAFFYNSYQHSGLPYVLGADAKEFARYVRVKELLKFQRANVECYFVFKGGPDNVDEKVKRIKRNEFDYGSNYEFVVPIFAKEVCLQMLEELGIKHATCVAGNMDDCVALAMSLGCPILSNNIEFCFKKVSYIPFWTLKYSTQNKYISCKQFKLENFLIKHSLSETKVAIFATILDVKQYDNNYFEKLFTSWGVSDENLYEQNKKLIKSFANRAEEEILNDISKFFANDNAHESFLKQMQHVLWNMQQYRESVVTAYLLNDCKLNITSPDPEWFEKGVALQKIPIPYNKLYKHKLIEGSRAPEKKTSSDSLLLSIDIIKYAYNLLTNYKSDEIRLYQDSENYITINVQDTNVAKPSYNCKESVFENGWHDIREMRLFEHFLKESNINLSEIYRFPHEGRMLLIALIYFSRTKNMLGTDVNKVIYCLITYYSVSHKLRLHDLHKTLGSEFDVLTRVTEKYFKFDDYEEKELFDNDGDDLKNYVEFQHCLLDLNYLNIMCGAPFIPTKYHRFVNSTFIFKLMEDMKYIAPDQFIDNLFRSVPTVLRSIKYMFGIYERCLKCDSSNIDYKYVQIRGLVN